MLCSLILAFVGLLARFGWTQECRYNFQVWKPDQNIELQLNDLKTSIKEEDARLQTQIYQLENKFLNKFYGLLNRTAMMEKAALWQKTAMMKLEGKLTTGGRDEKGTSTGGGAVRGEQTIDPNDLQSLAQAVDRNDKEVRRLSTEWLALRRQAVLIQMSNSELAGRLNNIRAEISNIKTALRLNTTTLPTKPNYNPVYTGSSVIQGSDLDCQALWNRGYRVSGVYSIMPTQSLRKYDVYCRMEERGGWTVIQRRIDGSMDFNQPWMLYQHGFGNLYGEFWLGNELLYLITTQDRYTITIDLEDWNGKKYVANYNTFMVENRSKKYKLLVDGYNGTAGDSFSSHSGQAFSTSDFDNDQDTQSCASQYKSGWWFKGCFASNLNGVYGGQKGGIIWFTVKESYTFSLKKAEMRIKPLVD